MPQPAAGLTFHGSALPRTEAIMNESNPNGRGVSPVALVPSSPLVDGWPSGQHAILLEAGGMLLVWLVLKHIFDTFNRPRRA